MTAHKRSIHPIAFDRGSARSVDVQGFLHVKDCNISKACVNPYWGEEIPDCEELGLDPNKVYYLLRDPKELEKAAATFNNLPLMDDHIEVSALDLEDQKVKDRIAGSTGTDARFEYPYLINDLVVWTAKSIDGVMSKAQTQLSSAYRYKLDMTPGVFEGQRYDGRMYDIIGNHVALVDEGRAGPDVTVKDKKLATADKLKVKVDMKGIGKMVADALAPIKKQLGMDDDSDSIPSIISQLNLIKTKIEVKLKPGIEGEIAQALDDCTSAIDSAIHHLLDIQEDALAKTIAPDANPEGINQYSGAAGHADKVGKAAGTKGGPSHKDAQAAHQKAALAANRAGDPAKTSAHLRVAAAHGALHSDPGNAMAKGVLAGHYGMRGKDKTLAADKIEHMPGHKNAKGESAPWVIKSETNGRIIWSGKSKKDAVAQLRNVEGHKAGAQDNKSRKEVATNIYARMKTALMRPQPGEFAESK